MITLFGEEDNQRALSRVINSLDGRSYSTEFEQDRDKCLIIICKSMKSHPEVWDERCQININWIGEQTAHLLQGNATSSSKEELDELLGVFFRFLTEFYLSTPSDLNIDLERARRFCSDNRSNFSGAAIDDINFALQAMPIAIVKSIANSPAIEGIKNLHSMKEQYVSQKTAWEKDLNEKEEQVCRLKESLENYKDAFNFVGLSEGFNQLAEQKKEEIANVLWWLRVVACLIVFPLVGEITYVLVNIDKSEELMRVMLLVMVPTVSLIAILVYYFRVLLSNYKSIQSQLLQIDLRMTLCRFIHNYSEYAGDMKKQDKEALSKFENIIFSSITPNSESIPSTFDGVEQIGKLIKSMK